MFRSLGLQTELLVMRDLSEFTDLGDHVVQRTPSEPDFWFGNSLIFKTAPREPEPLVERFRQAFPEARHVCLQWDVEAPDLTWFGENGFEIDRSDVLALEGSVLRPDMPEGLTLRPIEGERMWADVIALGLETGVEDGYEAETYLKYLNDRAANRSAQIERGLGGWFGVYDGTQLVASMGVLIGETLIRFQDVQTRKSHRRRGVCAALLGQVCDWAQLRSPQAGPVIIAEVDGDAGRIYRRAGFVLAERISSALLRPDQSRRIAAVT